MELYKSIELDCFSAIKKATSKFIDQFDKQTILNLPHDQQLLDLINDEVTSKGLSKIIPQLLIFKRWNPIIDMKTAHTDHGYIANSPINCSIVFPVSGCENTCMYWLGGDYELEELTTPTGFKYNSIKWKDGVGTLLQEVEILNSPMLARVDIPHLAQSNGKDFRVTCTIRFSKNEEFEEIYQKLSVK